MVKQIIKEAMEKNPIGLKEAVEAELAERLQLALEAKRKSIMEDDDYEEEELEESKTIKDLGQGIKITIDSDKSMTISDRTAPGGSQMVVLEPIEVENMILLAKANRPVVGSKLGRGAKMTIEKDGGIVIGAPAPGGREMVVLSAKQVQEILKLVKGIKESFDLSDLTLEELEDFVESAEFDQLDEISKKTLGSYIKKASDDMANNAYALGDRSPLRPAGSWNKAFKRKKGIEKATDRLTKESVNQKWEVRIGDKTYIVTARTATEANDKAEEKAWKEGNSGFATGPLSATKPPKIRKI